MSCTGDQPVINYQDSIGGQAVNNYKGSTGDQADSH